MTGPVFVDTNLLVYRVDTTEPDKHARAREWLDWLWQTRAGRVSTQVQHELYATLTTKLGLPRADARRLVGALEAWRPQPVDHGVVKTAWKLEDQTSLSWWDALVVAAARASGARVLLTEDLQSDADYDGVRILAPFSQPPPSGEGVHEVDPGAGWPAP